MGTHLESKPVVAEKCCCLSINSMRKPDAVFGKRKSINMISAGATVGVWSFFLLTLNLGFISGFFVSEGNKRVSVLSSLASAVVEIERTQDTIQREEEQISCHARDKSKDENSMPLCPSARPSKTFAAPNLEISFQPIESDKSNGECTCVVFLPLQKYHARNKKLEIGRRRRWKSDNQGSFDNVNDESSTFGYAHSLIQKSNACFRHDIPSLDFIHENQSRFQITKSSQVLLEEYHAHKQSCINMDASNDNLALRNALKKLNLLEGRLRSKIRAECRASLPLSMEDTLQILYCDAHICVVNKPSGVLSVPGHRRNPSLADLVYDTIQPSSCSTRDDGSIDDIDQSVVHRLDMATSGIIVYALSKQALQKLHVTFRDRKVQKIYQALVEGHLFGGTMEGEIDVALERDPTNPPYMRVAQPRDDPPNDETGNNNKADNTREQPKQHKFWREAPKPSKTTWSILSYEYDAEGNPLTRVALKPHTGRTHQLRVHTSGVLGAPIVGDDIYGSGSHDPNANLCLHAHRLCIHHPITGAPMVFEADPPF